MSAAEGSPRAPFRVLLGAASVVVVVAGLRAATPLLVPFLLAIFLSVLALPLLDWLQQRLPRALAVALAVLAILTALSGLGYLVSGSVSAFIDAAPRYGDQLQNLTDRALQWLERHGLPAASWLSAEHLDPGAVMDLLGGTLKNIASLVSNLLLVLLTTFFILIEAAGFTGKLEAAFGVGAGARRRFARIRREVQRYLAIKTLTSLATGALITLLTFLVGVDFPLLWGLLAFLLNYIPNLGSFLAAIPAVLLALTQLGVGRTLVLAAGYLAVNMVIGNLLEPHFFGRRLGLSTLVVFLSLVFWGWVWGPVGMLLSVPLTMIVKITLENTEHLHWVATLLDVSPPAEE